jgi:hypothetical protein
MKSPVGSRKPLVAVSLEDGLTAYRCPETGGHYLPAASYMRWLSAQPARLPQLPPADEDGPECETTPGVRLCPETGTIMTRYKVGHGFRFALDRSLTGGIWLDAGEWEALRSRNFHDEIHFIFTEPWQRKVRQDEIAGSERSRFEERIGPDLLSRVDRLRQDLAGHPHRDEILAYLLRS